MMDFCSGLVVNHKISLGADRASVFNHIISLVMTPLYYSVLIWLLWLRLEWL